MTNENLPTKSILDRVIMAVSEKAERINECNYGEVSVKIQDGRPIVVEVSETYKPHLGHAKLSVEQIDATAWDARCICGWYYRGMTCHHASLLLEEHIKKSR